MKTSNNFGIQKKKARFGEYLISYYFKKIWCQGYNMWYERFRLSLIVHKKIKIIDTNLGLSIFNYVLRNNKSFSQCMVSGKKE